MQISVKTLTGKTMTLDVKASNTIISQIEIQEACLQEMEVIANAKACLLCCKEDSESFMKAWLPEVIFP